MFSALTDTLGYEILLNSFPFLNVLRSGEMLTKLVRRLNLCCRYSGSIDTMSIYFTRYEVKADVNQCV